MKAKNIYIPIEIVNREFNGKLRLAQELKGLGHNVVIGYSMEMIWNINRTDCDILIINNADYQSNLFKVLKKFKNSGGHICLLENEGAVFVDQVDVLNRLDYRMTNLIDTYFAWSKNIATIVGNADLGFKNVCVSGHPMFDIYHEASVGNKVSSNFNPSSEKFILVNTNFALINEAVSGQYDFIGDVHYRNHLRTIMLEMMSLVNKLSDELSVDIVIRPHPSESHDFYKNRFHDHPNVHVIHDGPVVNWIADCSMLIHNSCTTAIEAFILDKKIVSWQPVKDYRFDLNIANNLGIVCVSYDDVKNTWLSEYKKREHDENVLYSLGNKSSPIIAREIDKLKLSYGNQIFSPWNLSFKGIKETVKHYLFDTNLSFILPKDHLREMEYFKAKFPFINEVDVVQMADKYGIKVGVRKLKLFKKVWKLI